MAEILSLTEHRAKLEAEAEQEFVDDVEFQCDLAEEAADLIQWLEMPALLQVMGACRRRLMELATSE